MHKSIKEFNCISEIFLINIKTISLHYEVKNNLVFRKYFKNSRINTSIFCIIGYSIIVACIKIYMGFKHNFNLD